MQQLGHLTFSLKDSDTPIAGCRIILRECHIVLWNYDNILGD
jgi:hypothetical protein